MDLHITEHVKVSRSSSSPLVPPPGNWVGKGEGWTGISFSLEQLHLCFCQMEGEGHCAALYRSLSLYLWCYSCRRMGAAAAVACPVSTPSKIFKHHRSLPIHLCLSMHVVVLFLVAASAAPAGRSKSLSPLLRHVIRYPDSVQN